MVENVKGIGGSGYVVKKDATVLDEYFEGKKIFYVELLHM